MSNKEFVSDWYDKRNIATLLDLLKPGDLLEFDRGCYRHWGVCLHVSGRHTTLIHRVGKDDVHWDALRYYSSVSLMPGSALVKGEIGKENLLDVLGPHRVRINNSRDQQTAPKAVNAIITMAAEAIDSNAYGEYHLVTNNCEHFAKMCRYDEKRSEQVRDAVGYAVGGVMLVGGALALLGAWLSSGKENEEKEEEEKQRKMKC